MRKPIIAGNWKMNKTNQEAVDLVSELVDLVKDVAHADVLVCPPFTALGDVAKVAAEKSGSVAVGAQNIFWEEKGAFTGEISPLMLKGLNLSYVIIGHSERRKYFGETDESVKRKIKAALTRGLNSIVCVGETLEQREQGKTQEVVQNQITKGLEGLSDEDMQKIVIAYEPIWAIGTGKSATSQDANDVIRYIRAVIGSQFSPDVAKEVRIQYGGSVKPDNIADLMAESDIDGALVGGASLDAQSFAQIVKYNG